MMPREPVNKEWKRLADAEELVAELIKDHHPELEDCLVFCFGKPKSTRRNGRMNVAKIRVASEFHKALAGTDVNYIIEIGLDFWQPALKRELRVPLLDHELNHAIGKDAKGRPHLTGHDVEEFEEIIRRYGIWEPGLQAFVKACQELEKKR
jgi:Putative phage metallopeptidase